eukprot:GEMP01083217.1.p1 GENE.GEMP01083217.1~~GEMP01083217.1.p1  ORF type:complete len:143 (+),score=13.05 GEMP01083217.1:64-492(+)
MHMYIKEDKTIKHQFVRPCWSYVRVCCLLEKSRHQKNMRIYIVPTTHGPRRQGLPQRRNNDECQVFVRNIPTEATEEDIFNVFYCYEPINVKVIRNKRFADVRGFVTFHCAKTAQRAAKCKINIMGRNLYLSLAQGTHRTKI